MGILNQTQHLAGENPNNWQMPQHFLNKTLPLPDYQSNKMQVLPKGRCFVNESNLSMHGEKRLISNREAFSGESWIEFWTVGEYHGRVFSVIGSAYSQSITLQRYGKRPKAWGDFLSPIFTTVRRCDQLGNKKRCQRVSSQVFVWEGSLLLGYSGFTSLWRSVRPSYPWDGTIF